MTRFIFSSFFLVVLVCSLGLLVGPAQPVFAGLGGLEVLGDPPDPPYPGPSSLWPGGNVPVLISESFTDPEKEMIWQGLNTWRDQTGYAVQFVSLEGKPLPIRYVHVLTPQEFNDVFDDDPLVSGCGSWGPQTNRPTYIWLQQSNDPNKIGCPDHLPSILHEIGHSIGLGHEHIRPDRDFYIKFVEPEDYKPPEDRPDPWPPDEPIQNARVGFFDYYSIMHQWPVITGIIPSPNIIWPIYPEVLSAGDIDTVRALYAFDLYYYTDIVGGDYANFPMAIDPTYGVPTQRRCQLACAADVRCKAYTYAGIGVLDINVYNQNNEYPYCFLKDNGSSPVPSQVNIHSGKRRDNQKCSFGAAFDVDLNGNQISNEVSMPHNLLNGKNCKELCLEDTECDAFTFVPGMDSGTCYKKTYTPDIAYQPVYGYVSGVVRRANDADPTSDAGGPYTQEWAGSTTTVELNGTGSSGSLLTYSWTTDCPGGTFDNPASPQPILTVNTSASCLTNCNVSLVVTGDQCLPSSSDSTTVTIQDTIPPVILCNTPDTGTITPKDAPVSFRATATDNCSTGSVEITSFNCVGKKSRLESCIVRYDGDTITISDSGGVGDTISWTVSATDASGNSSDKLCSVLVVNPGNNK
jgi:hypothetical protein